MEVGVIVPQGWLQEFSGVDPAAAWSRSVAIARRADQLGFESIWLYDHFHTIPQPADELTFESFTALSALAALTSRVRVGHIVICTGFRNPALTAKMIGTMDVISGGRMVLGIGAGWKEDEWRAYGYGFPPLQDRLGALADHLEVITRMLGPGRPSYEGRYASISSPINLPRGLQQPRVPVMVGGNGPNVTWRLAARLADEVNLDGMSPDEVSQALPVIRSRCEEIGRDPATLRVSIHIWSEPMARAGQERADLLGAYAALGVDRALGFMVASAKSDEAIDLLAEDVRAAGLTLAT
jgi:F420-dependent oxidoreductase-like protein